MRMTASLLLIAALYGPAAAQDAATAGRYTLVPVEGGALRLDSQTGAVSICSGDAGDISCRPLQEDASDAVPAASPDIEARISALEARIADLEARTVLLPDEESIDRAMTLADRVMRHFFGMVRELKRDMESEEL
jgi:hypothetical protein